MSSRVASGRVCLVLVGVIGWFSQVTFAQVIYEPVRYQYGDHCNVYYYGGTDPAVHQFARSPALAPGFGRAGGFAFASANLHTNRTVCNEPTRVFLDEIPFQNAAIYGATASDAANDANARVPLYFRKREQLSDAVMTRDGTFVVPSAAPAPAGDSIRITPSRSGRHVQPFPRQPRPLMIIPKQMLDPVQKPSVVAVD